MPIKKDTRLSTTLYLENAENTEETLSKKVIVAKFLSRSRGKGNLTLGKGCSLGREK